MARKARIACVLVSELPLWATLRARPELAGRPLAVATGQEGRAELIALSAEARAAGIRPGRTVAYARSACAELTLCTLSPALERAARESLLDVALSFSPRAAAVPRASGAFACEAGVWLDATGIDALFGDEVRFASALAARAEALGLPAVVGVANSRDISLLAARQRLGLGASENGRPLESVAVVPAGEEADFLGPLPIDLLDPDDRTAQTLTRFGIHRVHELLQLPAASLAQRLGPEVRQLLDRARGIGSEEPLPARRVRRLEEGQDLEFAIDRLEPLGFVLRGLLSRLIERLHTRGLACSGLDLHLGLEGGGRDARHIGVSAPTDDARVLLRLLWLALEASPPEAPVETLVLATEGRPQRRDQLDLFQPRGPDPAALDRTLSELAALCGEARVGAPQVPDDHRPGGFALEPFTLRDAQRRDAPAPARPRDTAAPRHLALRALRPPVRAEVRVERGRPASLRSAVSHGRIVEISGPWRTTGRWWTEEARYAVDHYDAQVSDGSVLRLCFDWVRREWQVDALYD